MAKSALEQKADGASAARDDTVDELCKSGLDNCSSTASASDGDACSNCRAGACHQCPRGACPQKATHTALRVAHKAARPFHPAQLSPALPVDCPRKGARTRSIRARRATTHSACCPQRHRLSSAAASRASCVSLSVRPATPPSTRSRCACCAAACCMSAPAARRRRSCVQPSRRACTPVSSQSASTP
jgi:hypothetical protein